MTAKSSGTKGKNLVYLRTANQGAILKTLVTAGDTSRQTLANNLHLTKMSITYIVTDLLEKGIIRESGVVSGAAGASPGRRPSLVGIRPDSLYAIGVYISRGHVLSSIANISGEVVDSIGEKLSAQTTRYTLMDLISQHIGSLLQHHAEKHIIGIGIASIGLVDIRNGTVVDTTDFYEIQNLNLREVLESRFPYPVFVVNDMKAAALAENLYGSAKEFTDFIYLGVTNGIGAGVVINGKLFEGSQGFSSEIGHTTIQRRGERCTCGNYGCMELYTSIPRLLQKSGYDNWADFLQSAEEGDKTTGKILDQFCVDMASSLVSITNIFDPQAIVIGHEGAMLPQKYYDQIQHSMDQCCMTRKIKRVLVLPSQMSRKIRLLGASALAFSQLFQGNIQI